MNSVTIYSGNIIVTFKVNSSIIAELFKDGVGKGYHMYLHVLLNH